MQTKAQRPKFAALAWGAASALLALAVLAGIFASRHFAAGRHATDMPILAFALALTAVGVMFLAMLPLIKASEHSLASSRARTVVWIFVVGLGLRLALMWSDPILEVDFNRYLWDGALSANGFNPYALAPIDVAQLPYNDIRLELSKVAASVFERISYPEYKTIYPPVAQTAFALSYWIAAWSLNAWRLIAISADIATFALLLALLRQCDRSPLWIALYWWSPLALKEIANSAHMECILLPLVMSSLLLSVRGRHVAATVVLGLAIGTKLWPIMLAPLILRPMLGRPRQLIAAIAILAAMLAGFATPVWLGGLDANSGFVGFANFWATNSALFPVLHWAAGTFVSTSDSSQDVAGKVVRLAGAASVLGLALYIARNTIVDARDMVWRAYVVTSALLLLSPAQFPWYVLWILPLATLNTGIGWHVAAAVMPLYYSAFHFIAQDRLVFFESKIVWLIWLPIWLALANDIRSNRRPAIEGRS